MSLLTLPKTLPAGNELRVTPELLKLTVAHPHYLGWLAGKEKLTQIHSDWIRYIWYTDEVRGLQAHRGAYKTTSIDCIGPVVWMLTHPDDRIALIRKTYGDAAEVVDTIAAVMEVPAIRELFRLAHGFYPKARIRQHGKLTYNFKYTATPEGNITAYGLDGSIVGHHFDKILGDDFETIKDRISRAERERTIEIVREIMTNIIDPGKGSGWSGTPWHRLGSWKTNFEDVGIPVLKFPASATGIRTPAELEKIRKMTTPFMYAANYDLELLNDESALFTDPVYTPWDFSIREVSGHLDAAFDGDHYNALTFMGRKGDHFQGCGKTYPGNVKDWIKDIGKFYRFYRAKRIYVEDNADKGYTADALRAEGLSVISYNERDNKHIKISTHGYNRWRSVVWDEDTSPEYMNQVLDYREGSLPDDAPDSFSTLIREAYPDIRRNYKHLFIPM